MTKLLINEVERKAIRQDNSLWAGQLKLYIAKLKFYRELSKTILAQFIHKLV